MDVITKKVLKDLIEKFSPKAFHFDCDYRVAEQSDLINTKRIVNARSRIEATRKLRKNFRQNDLKLVRFKDLTIM